MMIFLPVKEAVLKPRQNISIECTLGSIPDFDNVTNEDARDKNCRFISTRAWH
jgi:hypothetical protein